MNYENFKTGFNKPSIFTAQQYGTKTTVEVDNSDLTLDEVMDAFQTLIIGMGYHESSFKNWVIERADEYREDDNTDVTTPYTYEDFKRDEENYENLRHGYESSEELENNFFGKMDESEKRMDIIGQNGNEGLHYRATEEDEAEFDDYGMRVTEDRVGFEWGDEAENDVDLFEGDEWFANDNLKDANERYKREVKKMSSKQKRQSKK
jgi:hypothetical protein